MNLVTLDDALRARTLVDTSLEATWARRLDRADVRGVAVDAGWCGVREAALRALGSQRCAAALRGGVWVWAALPDADASRLGTPAPADAPRWPRARHALEGWGEAVAAELATRVDDLADAGVHLPDGGVGLVVGVGVSASTGATLWGGSRLLGDTVVAEGAEIGPACVVTDTHIGRGATLRPGCVAEGALLDAGASAGPWAHLRPGTRLGPDARIGNFVETKNTVLGAHAKANHLTYLGDCVVGEGSNIGAGTITCNYDGARKHPTHIGAGVFVGTHASLVAPVRIGDGALIAAGSVITEDVPADALALGRARQATVPDKGAAILARNRKLKAEGRDR